MWVGWCGFGGLCRWPRAPPPPPFLNFFTHSSPTGGATKADHAQYAPVYDIPISGKAFPAEVPVFIEVAKGSRMKYEWDSDLGLLRLDRVLHSAVFYPFDYGFIPQTLCGDGDPLDVLVMGDSSLEPGTFSIWSLVDFDRSFIFPPTSSQAAWWRLDPLPTLSWRTRKE